MSRYKYRKHRNYNGYHRRSRRSYRRSRGPDIGGTLGGLVIGVIIIGALLVRVKEYFQENGVLIPLIIICFAIAFGYIGYLLLIFISRVKAINRREMRFKAYEHADLEEIYAMSAREFEFFVSRVLFANGYEVKVTPASNDKGIDIRAFKNGIQWVVSCKKYRLNRPVPPKDLRDIFGSRRDQHKLRAMLVTTSGFTYEGYEWAKGLNFDLIDGKKLVEMNTKQVDLPWYRKIYHPPEYLDILDIPLPRHKVPIPKFDESGAEIVEEEDIHAKFERLKREYDIH